MTPGKEGCSGKVDNASGLLVWFKIIPGHFSVKELYE